MDENVKTVSPEELLGMIFGGAQAATPEDVHAKPTLTGDHGRAWQVDLAKLREAAMTRSPDALANDHLVAIWVVEAPGNSPYYHSYIVNLVTLEGQDQEHYLEGATHEFSLFPLSPHVSRDAMMSGTERFAMLSEAGGPMFAAQFPSDTHLDAIKRMSGTVQEICDGVLDPENEEAWVARFGNTNVDPAWVEREREEKAVARYGEAIKGLEVAAAYAAAKEPRNVEPSFLRAGVDSVNISSSALAKLLVSKGLISKAEYFEAVADQAVEEYDRYASRLGLPLLDCQMNDGDAE